MQCFGGRFQFGVALRLERCHDLFDLRGGDIARVEGGEHGLGLLAKCGVGDEVSIALEGGQVLPKFLAQAGIVRLLLERIQQRLCFAFLLLDFLLDAAVRCFLVCFDVFSNRLFRALHLADKGFEADWRMLHCVDEETDQRQFVGDAFEIAFDRNVIGLSETLDLVGTTA